MWKWRIVVMMKKNGWKFYLKEVTFHTLLKCFNIPTSTFVISLSKLSLHLLMTVPIQTYTHIITLSYLHTSFL
jgi:hypothetical protein